MFTTRLVDYWLTLCQNNYSKIPARSRQLWWLSAVYSGKWTLIPFLPAPALEGRNVFPGGLDLPPSLPQHKCLLPTLFYPITIMGLLSEEIFIGLDQETEYSFAY